MTVDSLSMRYDGLDALYDTEETHYLLVTKKWKAHCEAAHDSVTVKVVLVKLHSFLDCTTKVYGDRPCLSYGTHPPRDALVALQSLFITKACLCFSLEQRENVSPPAQGNLCARLPVELLR